MRKWINLGDVNPLEYNGFFVKRDGKDSFYIVAVYNMEEVEYQRKGWLIEDGYICLDDNWINWEAVKSFSGNLRNDYDKVYSAWLYYGYENFGGSRQIEYTKESVIDLLNGLGIEL